MIENPDREQQLVKAVKQKTEHVKGDRHKKIRFPSKPRPHVHRPPAVKPVQNLRQS